MRWIILFFLVVSVEAFAFDFRLFEVINKRHLDQQCYLPGLVHPIASDPLPQAPQALLNQCAIDLCGKPGSGASIFITNANLGFWSDIDSLMKDFNKRRVELEPFIRRVVSDNNKMISRFRAALDSGQIQQLIHDDEALKELAHAYLGKYGGAYLLLGDGESRGGEVTSPIGHLEIDKYFPAYAGQNLKVAIEFFVKNERNFREKSLTYRFRDLKISRSAMDSVVQYLWTEFISSLDKLTKQERENPLNNVFLNMYLNISRYDNQDEISFNYDAYREEWNDFLRAYDLVKAEMMGYSIDIDNPSFCDDEQCIVPFRKHLLETDFDELLLQLRQLNNSTTLVDSELAYCLSKQAVAHLRRVDVKSFKGVFDETYNNFVGEGLRRFSKGSKAEFKQYFEDNVQIVYPDLDFPRHGMDWEFARAKERHEETRVLSKHDLNYESILWLLSLRADNFGELKPLTLCGAYRMGIGADSVATSALEPDLEEDLIEVSLFSILNPQYGAEIVAHELGHLFSSFLFMGKGSDKTKQEYNSIRSCVAGLTDAGPFEDASLFREGDSPTTEEDLADLFAFELNKMSGLVMSCSLLELRGVPLSYASLDVRKNEPFGEVHSSDLLRVIRESKTKGIELSDSCKKALTFYPDIRFNQCL